MVGGLVGLVWLVLSATVPRGPDSVVASGGVTRPGGDETSWVDLVPPLGVLAGVVVWAAYAYTRRSRRTRTSTTPGGLSALPAPLFELDRQARRLLVGVDDAVRTSREELGFAAAQLGAETVTPFTEAVAYAERGLRAAFRVRQELDDTPFRQPHEDTTRRMLGEIIGRCTEAGRRLDSQAAGFDQVRAPERRAPEALKGAEGRFREVAGLIPVAGATLVEAGGRYAASAVLPVVGHVEQAEQRLLFASTHLDLARQAVDSGHNERAAVHLRAAEGAVDQAGILVGAVERLAQELATAAGRLSAALGELEDDLAVERGPLERMGVTVGWLRGRIALAESVLVGVRRECSVGPYDPIAALRRVAEAGAALATAREPSVERARGLLGQALLPARSTVVAAADFITTHRGAVGSEARTRLAEAERLVGQEVVTLADFKRADALARQARELAERDVRVYGNPSAGADGGVGGAVLGGIILGATAGSGMGGSPQSGPWSFGGSGTRGRRGGGGAL